VTWAARRSLYLLAQGALVLLAYAYYDFNTDPQSFALAVSPKTFFSQT
jgi:hypothetical protein